MKITVDTLKAMINAFATGLADAETRDASIKGLAELSTEENFLSEVWGALLDVAKDNNAKDEARVAALISIEKMVRGSLSDDQSKIAVRKEMVSLLGSASVPTVVGALKVIASLGQEIGSAANGSLASIAANNQLNVAVRVNAASTLIAINRAEKF